LFYNSLKFPKRISKLKLRHEPEFALKFIFIIGFFSEKLRFQSQFFFLKKLGPYSYSEKEVNLDISLYISDKKPTDSLKLEEQNFKVVGYV
jgi:hypothetical protein